MAKQVLWRDSESGVCWPSWREGRPLFSPSKRKGACSSVPVVGQQCKFWQQASLWLAWSAEWPESCRHKTNSPSAEGEEAGVVRASMAFQGCCWLLGAGCLFLWLPPALQEAQPKREEAAVPLHCRKGVEFVSCRGQGLPGFPQEIGHEARQMDVSHNFISSLTESDTSSLTRLEHLDLASNQLQAVSEGALKALGHLRSLLLATNRLHRNHVSNGKAFLSLLRLEVLDLSENSLDSEMAALYLHSLPSLEQLDLSRNHLTRLAKGIFQGVPRLRELRLNHNYIMEIAEGSLEPLRGLHSLNLAMNCLPCISGFSLRQLRVLNLSYNALEFFGTGGEVGGAYRLQALDLSHNQLASLPLLPSRSRLRHLNLSHNALGQGHWAAKATGVGQPPPWPRGLHATLAGLATVAELDLSYNQLSSFPVSFLRELRSLRTLSMASNCLRGVTGELPTHCPWQGPEAHRKAPGQQLLRDLAVLTVRKLDLRGNALQALPRCFFDVLPNLEALDLSLNNIHLCGAWRACERAPPSAERGNCTTFHHLPQLKLLSLRGNSLAMVCKGLFRQTPLASLDLSENEGLFLPEGALEGLGSSLQTLSLRRNQMQTSGMNFPCLGELKVLDLAENRLSALPSGLPCAPLEQLNLQQNQLVSLEEAVAVKLSRSLQFLSVAGNPLSCCELGWLEVFEAAAAVTVLDREEALCSYQDGNQSVTAQVSSAHGQPCPPDAHRPGGSLVAALLGAVGICTLCLTCGICCVLGKGKEHLPCCLGCRSHQVEPAPPLSPETASGQNSEDNSTTV
ncbi:transforming growth factor beta activator LRRC32-like [Hemicordylus capensis]|uniref:transforming growth factor beta activator LRRC32-like n=1 Tax=Hemicordylus capensis TaxID=884348 RepID=UPI00230487DA|nr:transforming growth factor beta activator LRRC32-like [Hemicordylus capensis]